MNDITPDTAPAVADTAPVGDASSPQAVNTPTEGDTTPQTTQTPDFTLPDEYKDKSWSDKVKSQDDAYKQIDNLTALVGKKTISPIDYETATPEQIAEHYGSLAPDDASSYDFGEGADPEFSAAVGGAFKEFGINEHQAKGLSAKINEIAAGMNAKQEADAVDGEKYAEMLKENFGSDYKEVYQKLDISIKKYAKDEDLALLRDGMPNTTKLALDRVLHNILTKHGAMESGAQGEGENSGSIATDVDTQRADLRKQAREIDGRAHTYAEKMAINNKLAATYK